MAVTDSLEIIDLTESPPPPEPIIVIDSDEDDVEIASLKGREGGKETRKSRRKRKRKGGSIEDGEVVESSTQMSRPHSRERQTEDSPSFHRSRYPDPPQRFPSPHPRDDFSHLFCVDVLPASFRVSVKPTISAESPPDSATAGKIDDHPKLLLPKHVSVFGIGENGAGRVEIIGPPTPNSDDEDDDFIEYLDYDDRNKGLVRYFDENDEDSKPTRFVCKNCGAEGEHKTIDCPVQICLTCGARNEHSTRSCPISKTCYTCGMKGHINQNCPHRYNRRGIDNHDDCDRCGSISHKTNECPTWWRMYEYVADEERSRILHTREAKQHLAIGEGGEGYIGRDDWCYNCGGLGHWGDDCNEVPHLWDFPREPSAFSIHNTMSGPFYDPAAEPVQYQASYHDHGGNDMLPEDWGMGAPSNVGKRGRKKDRAKLQKKFQEQETVSDSDNWFLNPANARSQPAPQSNGTRPYAPKIKIFGASMKEAGQQFQLPHVPERPKLIDRIQDGNERSRRRSQHDDRGLPCGNPSSRKRDEFSYRRSRNNYDDSSRALNGKERYGRQEERDRHGHRDRERQGDRSFRQEYSGPRYTGGYST